MYFCYRQALNFRKNIGRGYWIGDAYSNNLKYWVRYDASAGIDVSENGWDSDVLCYPSISECEGKNFSLYNSNVFDKYGFGIAVLA